LVGEEHRARALHFVERFILGVVVNFLVPRLSGFWFVITGAVVAVAVAVAVVDDEAQIVDRARALPGLTSDTLGVPKLSLNLP
jgi:hypothetical protein